MTGGGSVGDDFAVLLFIILLLRKMLTRKGEWCFFGWFLLELCLFF